MKQNNPSHFALTERRSTDSCKSQTSPSYASAISLFANEASLHRQPSVGGSCPLSTTATTQQQHDRRRLHTLAEKRSFLVRMVSDPKCYNPKIVRHLNMRNHNQTSQDLFRDRTLRLVIHFNCLNGNFNYSKQTSHSTRKHVATWSNNVGNANQCAVQ